MNEIARRLVLRDRVAALAAQRLQALRAVAAHPGEHHTDDFAGPVRVCAVEKNIYRGPIHLRARVHVVAQPVRGLQLRQRVLVQPELIAFLPRRDLRDVEPGIAPRRWRPGGSSAL